MTRHFVELRDWRLDFGPLSLHMPDDGPGELFDWFGAFDRGERHTREDSQDVLNEDRTWGLKNPDGTNSPNAEGGSGLGFGYARSDVDAVTIAARAKHNNSPRNDREHLWRQYSDDLAGFEMTREREFATRLLEYADIERAAYGPGGEVVLDKPEYVPDNIHQYFRMAMLNPHEGLSINGRAAGWAFMLEAMALKIDRKRSRRYAEMALDTCELAAFLGTGQICSGVNTGGDTTDPVKVVYAFHQSTLAIGAAALAFQIGRTLPHWIREWADALYLQSPHDSYGSPSPLSFFYTDLDTCKLVPATGPGQHPDPAGAWWSPLCVTIWRFNHDYRLLERARKFGPTDTGDAQSARYSMLYRGVQSIPRSVADV